MDEAKWRRMDEATAAAEVAVKAAMDEAKVRRAATAVATAAAEEA